MEAGNTIHQPDRNEYALADSKVNGTNVAGATRLAAARPAINRLRSIGRPASCWGSRFSSSGKTITGRATHAEKKMRATQPW